MSTTAKQKFNIPDFVFRIFSNLYFNDVTRYTVINKSIRPRDVYDNIYDNTLAIRDSNTNYLVKRVDTVINQSGISVCRKQRCLYFLTGTHSRTHKYSPYDIIVLIIPLQ